MNMQNDGPESILMLSSEYPPEIWGGLGTHVKHLVKELAVRDRSGVLVTLPSKAAGSAGKEKSFSIIRPPMAFERYSHSFEWMLNANFAWIKALHDMNVPFTLVHAHDWLTAGAALYAKKTFDVPLVATIHSLESGRKNTLTTSAEKWIHDTEMELIRKADHLIVCSQYMKQALIREGADPGAITQVKNGVSIPPPAENGKPAEPYLFSMGRFVPEKGFEDLIRAFSKLKPSFPDLELVIAGEGPALAGCTGLVRELNLQEDVTFPGFISGTELNKYIQHAAGICIPSRYEPFGLAALEAMAAGKPVAVSSAGGLPELVSHDENGWVFENGKIDQLIQVLSEMLSKPEKAQLLGKNALKESKNYSWSLMGEETLAVYNKLLQRK